MLLLLVFGDYEEDLDDRAAAVHELMLEFVDLVVPGAPHVLGEGAVDMRHDDILVMGPVEQRNPAGFRQFATDPPQIIMRLLFFRRGAEAVVMDAHRVGLAEHMPYDSALAGGIHAL